eukprot:403369004
MVNNYLQPISYVGNISNAISYPLFLFCGLLLNNHWIMTSIAIIINLVCVLLYIGLHYHVYDVGAISQIGFTTSFVIFAVYHSERLMKFNYLSLKYNERLNQDLKNLLLDFPKPIILLDEENKEVVLANKELYRLLSIEQGEDLKAIQQRIQEKILEPYNYIEGLGDSDQDIKQHHHDHQSDRNIQSESTEQKFNLYETIQIQESQNTCYQIKTTTNFENDIPHQNLTNIHDKDEDDSLIEHNNGNNVGEDIRIDDENGHDQQLPQNNANANNYLERDIQLSLSYEQYSQQNLPNQPELYSEIVNLKLQNMHFLNKELKLILFHRITGFVKYEKLKMENNFYEMITATVSHDMRTPINAITGLIEGMEQMINDAEGKKLIKVIKNSSKILLFLVNDILDFFQLKNGKFKSRLYKSDVKAAVNELIDMFELVATEKKVELKAEFAEDVQSLLLIDKQRLQQVLINLVSNSLKFTIEGHITIQVSYDAADHFINVKVVDTGVGVKSEDQEKLFKLFGKLDQTLSINTKGIGLGLNICKKVVEACGGKIHLESNYQDGAAFCFSMKAYIDKKQVSRKDFEVMSESDINSRKASLQSNRLLEADEIIEKDKVDKNDNSDNHALYQSFQMSIESSNERVNFSPYTTGDPTTIRSRDIQGSQRLNLHQQNGHQNNQQVDPPIISLPRTPSMTTQLSSGHLHQEIQQQQPEIQEQQQQQPRLSQNSRQSHQQQLSNCPCANRPQILIVDDNVFNIITLQTILEMQFKQRVEKATNGLEGIEKVKERQRQNQASPCLCGQQNENFKIIFMDCNMPIMDGFEATRAIRKLPGIDQHELVIIALTANANKSFKNKCFQAGMDEFQTKPVTSDQLKSLLTQRGIYGQDS